MKYSPKYFWNGLPAWKRKKDSIPNRIIYRPLSFLFSSFFASIGWTANTVSYLSVIIGVIASLCFAFSHPIIGAILINLWLVIDDSDGNIARCIKKESYGDFVDGTSSYLCVAFLFPCLGVYLYTNGGVLFSSGNAWIILIGSIAAIADCLTRLCYQKFQNSSYLQGVAAESQENPEEASRINKLRMKVDANISLGGFLPIIILIATCSHVLDLIVVLWAIYYGLIFLASYCYLILKTIQASKKATAQNKKCIITYGTFDLLHYGHINLLKRAKEAGDYLIVGLSTDDFNWEAKHKQSFFSYDQRKAMIEAISYVDLVIPEESWDQKRSDIQKYHVDILVIGDDWQGKFDYLEEEGCKVVYLPRTPEISTTKIKRDLSGDISE